jgi:hypothetical protein
MRRASSSERGMTLQTLADEVLGVVAPDGVGLKDVARILAADVQSVRAAFAKLDEDGRAILVRRGRGGAYLLFPLGASVKACVICHRELTGAKRKGTKTCSRSCAHYLAWRNPAMRAKHQASVKASRADPKVRARMWETIIAAHRTPESRAKKSETNRRSWADPEQRVRRVLSIKAAWDGDAARKARHAELKQAHWSDPEYREKALAAMRNGRRGRFKRAVIALASIVPEIPEEEIARRTGLSLEQVKIIMRRAYKLGELARKPADGRRTNQSGEQVASRVAATRRTKLEREGVRP